MLFMSETRDYIIDQAYFLFLNRSYEAVSISDLSKAIGLTKGALYHHFLNKEELFKAVIDKYLVITEIEGNFDTMSVAEYIKLGHAKSKEIVNRMFKEDFNYIPINYLSMFVDAFRHYPDFAEKKSKLLNTETEKIKQVLENGIKSGEIRSDINTSIMAMNIFSLTIGIAGNLIQNVTPTKAIEFLQIQLDEVYKLLKI